MRPLFGCVALLLCACSGKQEPDAAAPPSRSTLKVCADPNNLPYSNAARQGFENKLADLIARNLNAELAYYWQPQRRGYVRNTLKADACDVIIGVPSESDMLLTTIPYYRSSYVFVTRKGSGLHLRSMNSPELRKIRVGVQIIGDDYANTPPVHALAERGIIRNVSGYRVTDDYAKPNPPARLIEAVSAGDVDVAIAWGPIAGYFTRQQSMPLEVTPIPEDAGKPYLPFVFDISMGVRRGSANLKRQLDAIIKTNSAQISGILRSYGVPLVSSGTQGR
jgi:mxaJ protein